MSATRRSRAASVVSVVAALALGLSACSGDDTAPAAAEGSTSPEASGSGDSASLSDGPSEEPTVEPYLPVPDGVELTPQGSLMEVGDTATVAYEPNQKKVGVLDLTVREIEKTTFEKSFQGWKLNEQTKKATPYFVRATVANVGRTNLGGLGVPLYLLDDSQTLVESSSFEGDFEPCGSKPLPDGFKKGSKTKVCLVFLAPPGRTLEGVTFRPDQAFDAITWTGDVKGEGNGKKNGNGGGQNGGGGNGGGGNGGGGNGGGNG